MSPRAFVLAETLVNKSDNENCADEVTGDKARLGAALLVCTFLFVSGVLYSVYGNADGSIGIGDGASLTRRLSFGSVFVLASLNGGYLTLRSYQGFGYTFPGNAKWLANCMAALIAAGFFVYIYSFAIGV